MIFNKKLLKTILLKITGYFLLFSGLYYVLDRLFTTKGIYILMYHKISKKKEAAYFQDIAVKQEEFIKQLNYFTNKYNCISMSEAVSIINTHRLDKNYLVFTFDDGYIDNLHNGAHLLKSLNIEPIIYLTAGNIDRKEPIWTEIIDGIVLNSNCSNLDFNINGIIVTGSLNDQKSIENFTERIKEILKELPQKEISKHIDSLAAVCNVDKNSIACELLNWDQVLKLIKFGWEIGSHTLNHINLAIETESTVISELECSLELIGINIHDRVAHFAYPFGKEKHYNDFTVEAVKKYYRSAVTTTEGINKYKDNVHLLRRIMIANHHSLTDIKIKLLKTKIMSFILR